MSIPLEKRLVTQIPLEEIWTPVRLLHASRGRTLNADDIASLLRSSAVRFAVADCGSALHWVSDKDSFAFWKTEAKSRIVDTDDAITPVNYPGAYCYLASEWVDDQSPEIVILLEKYH